MVVAMALQEEVHAYWQARACGTAHASATPGTPEYYRQVELARYRLEPFIHGFVQFDRWRGRRVLEIGVGAGTDFVNFARARAQLSGIDLTSTAVDHVRRRLELEGLHAEVSVANGESLPYPDASFDLVYSWGVVHHAERPARIIREARRVLAPGGEAKMMLYGRHSWVAYGLWVRHALSKGRPWLSLSEVVAGHMESCGTRAYTRRELEMLFSGAGFDHVEITGVCTPYDRRVAGPVAAILRQDWFLEVTAR